MILAYTQLLKLIEMGVIAGETERVNAASIDVTLANTIYVEDNSFGIVDLARKETPSMRRVEMRDSGFIIPPGGFVVARTREQFKLPDNISTQYRLNKHLADGGLDHLNSGWQNAGRCETVLTLHFKNVLQHHTLRIRPGMICGQMIFIEHGIVPDYISYAVKGGYTEELIVPQAQPERRTHIKC